MKIPYQNTTIAPERTKADIEKMLKTYGVKDIQWTTLQNQTTLSFLWNITLNGQQKQIMFQFAPPIIPVKKRSWINGRYQTLTVNLDSVAYRLLWHYLKNKLEAVRWGLQSMEKEFLSHAVVALPNGQTTTIGDQIGKVYDSISKPALDFKG